MDADPRDRLRLLQADVRPRLAGVGGLVDAVALDDVAAQLGLAHPGVDDVGIRRRDRDGADRRGLDLLVGDRPPRQAAVGRLPDAAAGRAEVVLERPAARCPRRSASGRRGSGRSSAIAGRRRATCPPAPAAPLGRQLRSSTARAATRKSRERVMRLILMQLSAVSTVNAATYK